ncbi:TPA: cupredoxin family copper-binding protein [Methanosarcinaceae archaeon]|nr:cupredoxin family copper-binding protein [Methanosarcinaceae archaeon]
MRTEIIIFLIIFGVLFAAGCAGYGDSEEVAPAAPGEEEAEAIEPADEAGNDEEPEMEEEETETGAEVEEGAEEETDAEEPAAGAGEEIIDVEIRDFTYIPDTLTVEAGQTIRWTNYDTAIHNVVGSGLESDTLQEGDTFTFTFEEEGTYDYICTFHPWMEGTVIVEA